MVDGAASAFVVYRYFPNARFNRPNIAGKLDNREFIFLANAGADISVIFLAQASQLKITASTHPLSEPIYYPPYNVSLLMWKVIKT